MYFVHALNYGFSILRGKAEWIGKVADATMHSQAFIICIIAALIMRGVYIRVCHVWWLNTRNWIIKFKKNHCPLCHSNKIKRQCSGWITLLIRLQNNEGAVSKAITKLHGKKSKTTWEKILKPRSCKRANFDILRIKF